MCRLFNLFGTSPGTLFTFFISDKEVSYTSLRRLQNVIVFETVEQKEVVNVIFESVVIVLRETL